jgi:hypothetical protein
MMTTSSADQSRRSAAIFEVEDESLVVAICPAPWYETLV